MRYEKNNTVTFDRCTPLSDMAFNRVAEKNEIIRDVIARCEIAIYKRFDSVEMFIFKTPHGWYEFEFNCGEFNNCFTLGAVDDSIFSPIGTDNFVYERREG